jgi:AcrR family transcriptional regulator
VPRWKNTLQTNASVQRLKREAVLKEARRAFGKRGYHNTSLDDIAEALQVSKGTLYNYIKDKQELLYECHTLALDIGERAVEFGKERGATGGEILHHVLMYNITSLTEEFGACAVLTEVDALRPADRIKTVKRRDSIEKRMVGLINDGIKDGSIRPLDQKIAVFTIMGVISWLPRWYSPDGRLSGRDIAAQITNLLMPGLLSTNTPVNVTASGQSRAPLVQPQRKRIIMSKRAS